MDLERWCNENDGHYTKSSDTTPGGHHVNLFKCKITGSVHHGDLNVGPTRVELRQTNGEEYAQVVVDNPDHDVHHDLDLASDRLELRDDGEILVERDYGMDSPEIYKI